VAHTADTAIDTATVAQLDRVRGLVCAAAARITHLLVVTGERIGAHERHQLEEAALELRHAVKSLNEQAPPALADQMKVP
jgi:hypothetical protein